jgi:hypothetical protein
MKYKLNNRITKILSSLPENGMGSQHVNLHLKNNVIIENVTVFNSQEFESNISIDVNLIEKVEIYGKKENLS